MLNRRTETLGIVVSVAALCVFGLLMLYSSSYVLAGSSRAYNFDRAFFVKRQFVGIVMGFAFFLLIQRLDDSTIKKAVPWVTLGTLAALALVFVPHLGVSVKGAKRWLRLAVVNVQPSEFARYGLIAYFAYKVDRKGEDFGAQLKDYLPVAAVWFVMSVLLLLEPDYGMVILVTGIFFFLVFVTGFPMKILAPLTLAGAAALGVAVVSSPYRMKRIFAFLNPLEHARGSGYQVVQSLIAFANGGAFGTGIGAGKQKLFYLPEIHTDYIFSVIGEELGFFGVAAIATIFILFLYACYRVSLRARDGFGRIFALGVGFSVSLSAFMNMCVCLKLLPPKGMVLPFISYGRSSVIAHLAAVGLVVRISRMGRETAKDEDPYRRWWHRRSRLPRTGYC
ncbi:MAG: putative lipid II flippase FtsW [Deltaproteobacteria bacterium]|nr:MAG: putative lipid II flippase FtsW [Deltaproteobacteria bacterium]